MMYRARNEELIHVEVCVCDRCSDCWLHRFLSDTEGVLPRAVQSMLECRHRILVLTMCDFERCVFFRFSNAFLDSVCNKGMTRLGVFWQAVQAAGAVSVKAVCLFASMISLCMGSV